MDSFANGKFFFNPWKFQFFEKGSGKDFRVKWIVTLAFSQLTKEWNIQFLKDTVSLGKWHMNIRHQASKCEAWASVTWAATTTSQIENVIGRGTKNKRAARAART